MGLRALPQLDYEDCVRFVVADPNLVCQAANLLERGVACSEVRNQFTALAGNSAQGAYICERHDRHCNYPHRQNARALPQVDRRILAVITGERGRRLGAGSLILEDCG